VKGLNNTKIENSLKKLTGQANEIIDDTFKGYSDVREEALHSAERKNKEFLSVLKQLYRQINESKDISRDEYASIYSILGNMQKLKFDHDKLINYTRLKNINSVIFPRSAAAEVEDLFQGTRAIYSYMGELLLVKSPFLLRQVFRQINKYELVCCRFAIEHERRIVQGICPLKACCIYVHIVETFEDIFWHQQAIVKELGNI